MYGLNSDLMKQYQLQQVRIWPQVSKNYWEILSNPCSVHSVAAVTALAHAELHFVLCQLHHMCCVCGPGFELCLWDVDNHCSAWPSRPVVMPDKEMPGWFICSHVEAFVSCILLPFWNSSHWSSIFCDFHFLAVLHCNIHIIVLHLWLEYFLFLLNLPGYACFGMGFARIFISS